MPFLKHILEPQLRKHFDDLQAQLPPVPQPVPLPEESIVAPSQARGRGYLGPLTTPPAPPAQNVVAAPQNASQRRNLEDVSTGGGRGFLAQPAPTVIVLPAAVSEADARKQGDGKQAAQRAVDENKTRIAEALAQIGVTKNPKDVGPGGQGPIDRRKRIDALANKETWTADDLATITDQDLAVARGARGFLRENPAPAGVMPMRGEYGIAQDPLSGDKSVEMFSPDVVAGTELGGYRGLTTDLRFDGEQRPDTPIRVPGYEKPAPLAHALQGMTHREAAGYLANQMRMDELEKKLGYRPASL